MVEPLCKIRGITSFKIGDCYGTFVDSVYIGILYSTSCGYQENDVI